MASPSDILSAGQLLAPRLPMPMPGAWLNRLLQLGELENLYDQARQRAQGKPLFGALLNALDVDCDCKEQDLKRIPARGGVVVVANHPFGLLDGPVLGTLLLRVRPDVRFLANSVLASVPELRDYLFPVDPFGGPSATAVNIASLRRGLEWLKDGGLLVVFPAGEVASMRPPRWKVEDACWHPAAARLVRRSGATVVPVYVHGSNGAGFQAAGLLDPRWRTALLGRELLNKRGQRVRVNVGTPVSAARLAALGNEAAVTEYLRRRAHLLRWRQSSTYAAPRHQKAVAHESESTLIQREICALPTARRMAQAGSLAVYSAAAAEIPHTLREIGRLRELTFRLAGEGTGKELDLDHFDSHYQHLFVWNAERNELAGAYRLAETAQLIEQRGLRSLYTASLFHLRGELFRKLGPAIELGRSFVRPEYQRAYQPLLLLWRGIGETVARHPECRYLFGPVSISPSYGAAARQLMVSYLQDHCLDGALRLYVRPRRAFRCRWASEIAPLAARVDGLSELDEALADIEPDGRTTPVLLRHYMNVGGRFLAFSVDRQFSDVIDGLVVVDLLRTNPRLLRRHLGEIGAQRFLDHHTRTATAC